MIFAFCEESERLLTTHLFFFMNAVPNIATISENPNFEEDKYILDACTLCPGTRFAEHLFIKKKCLKDTWTEWSLLRQRYAWWLGFVKSLKN